MSNQLPPYPRPGAMPDTANPKDAAGRAKVPLHLWPASATAMGSVGLLEGELKYGRNNFRATPVAASVYVASCKRHLDAWMEGQEVTADTGSPHLGNALACLAIIVDTQANGTLIDDRNYVPNPGAYDRLVAELTAQCAKLKELFKDKSPKHWDARDRVAGAHPALGAPYGGELTPPFVREMPIPGDAQATHAWGLLRYRAIGPDTARATVWWGDDGLGEASMFTNHQVRTQFTKLGATP